jgi:hypothetical protein
MMKPFGSMMNPEPRLRALNGRRGLLKKRSNGPK